MFSSRRMHMGTKYFYTDLYSHSAEPAKVGLGKAINEARRRGVTDIVLCVSQLSSLDGTFSEAFGESIADLLMRKGFVRVQGITFYLATKRKKPPRLSKFVVFGLEIKPEEIEQLSQSNNVIAIVYMPLHKSELDDFIRLFPESEHVKSVY